ncbi:TonB-denpendent receptor [Salinisphaera orenii YIM 95161]|uniref:TonB-denpendent receptor n=2 Tax=Salinisphaera TaxID=180541 RepID=A0A423PIX4_9GAMM|nr:TonB-denpendent receptor [Salinisphaera halophila YIM 95161]
MDMGATRGLCMALGVLCATTAAAQDSELGAIEVIGATPFSGSDVDAERYPANVQQGSAEDIADSATLNLNEYMNQELGSVHVNDATNNPFQPDLNYRGYTASPLLGLPQGLSVYQDGVRVNEPFGDTVNWGLIPDVAIDSIDLVPGSNPLFGQNTLGGALSVKTKTGFTYEGSEFEFFGGDFGRYGGHVQAGGNDGETGWYFAAQGMSEDGWRDFSDSEVTQLFTQFSTLTDNGTLDFSITAADNTLRGNGAVPRELADAEGRDSIFTYPDETNPNMVMLNLRGTGEMTEDFTLAWGAYYRRNEINTFNGDGSEFEACDDTPGVLCEEGEGGDDPEVVVDADGNPIATRAAVLGGTQNTSQTKEDGFGLNLQGQQDGVLGGELIVGTSLDYGSSDFQSRTELASLTDERGTVGSGVFSGESLTGVSAHNSTASLFFMQRTPLTDSVEATLSGRYNRTAISLHDTSPGYPGEEDDGTSLSGDHEFKRLNLAGGLTWEINDHLTSFGSVSQSSRAPSPVELTCANPDAPCRLPNGFVDDPPLEQVVATTYEIGLRGGGDNLHWSAAAFRSDNQDDILFIAAESRFAGYFDNVGKTRRQGIELGLDWTFADSWRVSANYTYLNAEFRDPFITNSPNHPLADDDAAPGDDPTQQVESGDRIPLIPEHLFNVGLDWRATDRLMVGMDVIGNGDQIYRGDESNTDDEQIDGYAIVNANASFKVTDRITTFVRVNNLFDSNYETFGLYGEADEVLEGDRYEDASRFIGPGAPRGIWGGVRVEL